MLRDIMHLMPGENPPLTTPFIKAKILDAAETLLGEVEVPGVPPIGSRIKVKAHDGGMLFDFEVIGVGFEVRANGRQESGQMFDPAQLLLRVR